MRDSQEKRWGPEQEILGQFLRRLRLKANMSQEDLALQLSIDRSAVSRWESGQRTVDFILVYKVIRALGRDPNAVLSYLCEDLEEVPQPPGPWLPERNL